MTTQQQMIEFTNCLWIDWGYGDVVELRALDRNSGKVYRRWGPPSFYLENIQWLQQLNQRYDLYCGVNPRKSVGESKATAITMARCLFAEFDNMSMAEASMRVDAAGLPIPTCIVWSGGGPHLYWRMEEPLDDLFHWTHLQKRLIVALGSDKTIQDPPRIMRLPGFFNHKPGRTASRLVYAHPHARYTLRELAGLLPGLPEEKHHREVRQMEKRLNAVAYARKALREEATRVANAVPGNRNVTLHRSAFKLGQLIAAGLLTQDQIEDALLAGCAMWDRDFSDREKRTAMRTGIRAGMNCPRSASR